LEILDKHFSPVIQDSLDPEQIDFLLDFSQETEDLAIDDFFKLLEQGTHTGGRAAEIDRSTQVIAFISDMRDCKHLSGRIDQFDRL